MSERAARIEARLLYYFAMSRASDGEAKITAAQMSGLLEVPKSQVKARAEDAFRHARSIRHAWKGSTLVVTFEAQRTKAKLPEAQIPGAAREIFEHWVSQLGKSTRTTKLTSKRRKAIEARLREGYTVEDIKTAVEGLANSPFHRGQNEGGTRYEDILQVVRDGGRVEMFRDREIDRVEAERAVAGSSGVLARIKRGLS